MAKFRHPILELKMHHNKPTEEQRANGGLPSVTITAEPRGGVHVGIGCLPEEVMDEVLNDVDVLCTIGLPADEKGEARVREAVRSVLEEIMAEERLMWWPPNQWLYTPRESKEES
jgi:hypothetical protein